MRFQKQILRYKGVAGTVLGSDVAPTGLPSGADNVLEFKAWNANGWPCHRLVVAYKPPSGVFALTATAYIWDALTLSWYRVGTAATPIAANAVTYFDVPTLIDPPATDGFILVQNANASSLVALVVADPGAAPNGEHSFAIAADQTTGPGP